MALDIYFDGDCPFCTRYVALLRLSQTVGPVTQINVREDKAALTDLLADGFNLDEGMVIDFGDRRLGGADAVHALALLSTPSTFFNRLNHFLLSNRVLAGMLYPIMRLGRSISLAVLGRKGIMPR